MKKALPLFLLSLLCMIFSCKEDDFEPHGHEHGTTKNKQISFREFLELAGNKPEAQKIRKYFRGTEFGMFAKSGDSIDWEIDTTQISMIITPELTTYTFGVIEHDTIEGFRNVIVKEAPGNISAYLVHYPRGVDFIGHTSTEVYVQQIDYQGKYYEGECYIMVFGCLLCHEANCNVSPGWRLQSVPCDDGEGEGGGGADPDDPGHGDNPGLPTDPIPGGGGSSGDGNNNQTPCQALTQKSNETNFRNKINELKGKLNSSDENGYVNQNPNEMPGTNTNQTNQYNLMQSKTGSDGLKKVITRFSGPNVFGFMHTHPIHEKYMGVHSTGDIQAFAELLLNRDGFGYSLSETYCIVIGSHGIYSLKLEDSSKFNIWCMEYSGNDAIGKARRDKYFVDFEEEYKKIRAHENTRTNNERSILTMLNMYYSDFGIGIYRAVEGNDNITGWQRMTLDANNNPKFTNCN